MTHLRIEQSTGSIEEVTLPIISKLYELVYAGLDASSNLQGRLHCTAAYGYQIDYLTQQYPSLYINADKRYFHFEDPVVELLCATKWGDGTGITESDMLSVTSIDYLTFSGNTNIQTFDELGDFPNLTRIDTFGFDGCTNLRSIDLSNILYFGGQALRGTALTGILNLPSAIEIGNDSRGAAFGYIEGITEVHIGPNFLRFVNELNFRHCSLLTKITGLENIASVPGLTFREDSSLLEVDISSAKIIGAYAFSQCGNLTNIGELSGKVQIGRDAFSSNTKLLQSCIDNVEVMLNNDTNGNVGGLFGSCHGLTEITLSTDCTNIGSWTFYNCSKLERINNTSLITQIGESAFNQCVKLTSLDLSSLDTTDSGVLTAFATDSPYDWNRGLFTRCSELTTLGRSIFPDITKLGQRSFTSCTKLAGSLIFPDLTTEGREIFSGCRALEYVYLGHIQTLLANNIYNHDGEFYNCENLKAVYLGDSITNLSLYQFTGCTQLRAVIINNTTVPGYDSNGDNTPIDLYVTRNDMLGNSACFLYVPDSAVATYKATYPWSKFPDAVKSFKEYPGHFVFYNETFTNGKYQGYGFGSLKIVDSSGSGVITPGTFKNNANLEEVNLDGITTLGGGAFEGCTSLESIDLSNVTSVDSGAFMYDSALTDIGITNLRNHIGSTIGALMFLQCSNLTGPFDFTGITRVNGSAFSESGLSGELSLPDILRIDWQNAFASTNITKVTLGSGVTYIGGYPFNNCTNLTEVNADFSNITGNDRYISGFVMNCTSLTTVNITGLEVIGLNFFRGCTGLTQLTGLSNITDVGTNGITGCTNLVSTDIDWTKMTSIGLGAFADCYKLQISSLNTPNLTNLSGYSFLNCKKLQSITNLGSTITAIEEATFNGCTELTSVTLPSSVTEIKKNGFYGCTTLTTINLSNITKINTFAFNGCSALTNVDVSKVVSCESKAFNNTNISRLIFPKLLEISSQGFNSSYNYLYLEFGEDLTTIGVEPFWGSTNLNTLVFRSTTVPTYTDPYNRTFLFNMSNLTIYVPDASLNDYKTTGLWASMADHIKGISELPVS